tara:strand:+ start:219 stop:608 length:390 start_codon:yes stop_codon:yes gene_type:complete
MNYNPCKVTALLVPYIVLNMMIKSKKYSFMITGIPMTFTTIAFHYNLVKGIRKYDIAVSLLAYLHQTLYYIVFTRGGGKFYYMLPGLLYVVDKIFEELKYIKTSYYFHALSHLAVIPCVYFNTKKRLKI